MDSDKDSVSDADETNGIEFTDGTRFTSRADRRDTEFELATNDCEYRRGTNPRTPHSNELGIPGLEGSLDTLTPGGWQALSASACLAGAVAARGCGTLGQSEAPRPPQRAAGVPALQISYSRHVP